MFVGNVAFDATELELQDLFATAGPVAEVNIVTDRDTGKPRGFAFVTMGTPEAARSAIQTLSGQELHGRALTVTEARPREARPPRSGGYGGGYGGGGGRGGERGGERGGGRGGYGGGERGDRGDRGGRRDRPSRDY